jgi:hypothetical protein
MELTQPSTISMQNQSAYCGNKFGVQPGRRYYCFMPGAARQSKVSLPV